MASRICVAQIGAAHGISGEVRLRSFTEDPAAVASYGPLESEDGKRHFEIEALRPVKGGIFVVRLAGVKDRNAAERLTNIKLYVPRERLPPTEDDTFYHSDLIGLAAVTPDGTTLGKVTAMHRFGAGDLVEITPPDGGETLLVPFSIEAVPMVDIAGGKIVVVPPLTIE